MVGHFDDLGDPSSAPDTGFSTQYGVQALDMPVGMNHSLMEQGGGLLTGGLAMVRGWGWAGEGGLLCKALPCSAWLWGVEEPGPLRSWLGMYVLGGPELVPSSSRLGYCRGLVLLGLQRGRGSSPQRRPLSFVSAPPGPGSLHGHPV